MGCVLHGYLIVQLIFIWSHGRMMICEDKTFNIKKLLMNINMIASAAGMLLFVFHLQLPLIISETLGSVGSMIGPASMMSSITVLPGTTVPSFIFR